MVFGLLILLMLTKTSQGKQEILRIGKESIEKKIVDGTILWQKTIELPYYDIGFAPASGINTLLVGSIENNNKIEVVEIDSNGKTVFSSNIKYSDEVHYALINSSKVDDGRFVIGTKFITEEGRDKVIIAKYILRNDNPLEWSMEIPWLNGITKIEMLENGDIIIAGYNGTTGVGGKGWISKIDNVGNIQWIREIGRWDNWDEQLYNNFTNPESFVVDIRNFIYVVGYTSAYAGGPMKPWIIKYDKDGEMIWKKMLFLDDNIPYDETFDYFSDITISKYGNLMVTGSGDVWTGGALDSWLLEFTKEGEIVNRISYAEEMLPAVCCIAADKYGGIIIAGTIDMINTGFVSWIATIDEKNKIQRVKYFDKNIDNILINGIGDIIVSGIYESDADVWKTWIATWSYY